MQTNLDYSPPRWFFKSVAWFAIGLIAFFSILNVQPWLAAAKVLAADSIKVIPFGAALSSIPFFGPGFQWMIANILMLGGVVIWGIVQAIQVAPLFAGRPGALHRFQLRAKRYQDDPANEGAVRRLDKRLDRSLTAELDALDDWRGAAYLTEFLVCLFYYPVYSDGTQALMTDLLSFNIYPELINYAQLVMVLVTMLGFEALTKVALVIWSLAGGTK